MTARSRSARVSLLLALVAAAAALLLVFGARLVRREPPPAESAQPGATRGTGGADRGQVHASTAGPARRIVTTNAPSGPAALGSSLDRLKERQMHSLADDDWRRLTVASGSRKTEALRKRVRASTGPLLSSVRTDQEQLCAGQTLLVQADTFHTGTRVWINGTEANPATVQLHQPGRRFVYVRAEGGPVPEDADVQRVEVDVQDCGLKESLLLSATASPVHDPTVIVRVTLPPRADTAQVGDPLAGYSFLYDFGDGVVEQSNLPIIQHTYGPSGEGPSVHYITVTATDAHGQELSGRTLYTYRRTRHTPAVPPPMPEWIKPQGDPIVEARKARDRAEQLRALPEAYRAGRAQPPEGPLGAPQAWASPPPPATSDDGVRPQ